MRGRKPRLWALLVGVVVLMGACLQASSAAGASAATPTWTVVPSPDATGPSSPKLLGVSCVTSNSCIAVGSMLNSNNKPTGLAETWNGTRWTAQPVPQPGGSASYVLNAVSCVAGGACVAVGSYVHSGTTNTLAESWNGSAWKQQSIGNSPSSHNNQLFGISCTSTSNCLAVGSDFGGIPIAEHWNGSSWTLLSPIGSTQSPVTFSAVSCPSQAFCMAAGLQTVLSSGKLVQEPLAETWNGTSWSAKTVPVPAGATGSSFTGVACMSATSCDAVGTLVSGSATTPLAEGWNGTSWKIQPITKPTGSSAAHLTAVSCTAATTCTGVGSFLNATGKSGTLAESWNGTTWTAKSLPTTKLTPYAGLSGISCLPRSSPVKCTAVGTYPAHGAQGVLAMNDSGTTWTVETADDPMDQFASQLHQVVCPAAGVCFAVGGYNKGGQNFGLVEHLSSGTWSVQAAPTPAGASTTSFNDVACASTVSCVVVGSYGTKSGSFTLVEGWNGTSWAIQSSPSPSSSASLVGVSCPTATTCMAVGNSSGAPLAESWDGSSWSVQSAPSPTGVTSSWFNDVSCSAATVCVAVGGSQTTNPAETRDALLAEHWDGSTWILDNPAEAFSSSGTSSSSGGNTGTFFGDTFNGVSCPGTSVCIAVGTFFNPSQFVGSATVAEAWDGQAWTMQSTPPNNDGPNSNFGEVSCPSATVCFADGAFVNNLVGGAQQTLAESWIGNTWTMLSTPNPAGAFNSYLSGITCASATTCTAVGWFNNGADSTLVEQYQ